MYLLCVFRPRTPHREIRLLCMTIMCTWNSSLASVLKKGENRCHRKISAQFCFCSRRVGVLKCLFWLWSSCAWGFGQTSSPALDDQGPQRATRWSELHGQTRSWGTSQVKEMSLGLSISMHLHHFIHNPVLPPKQSSTAPSFVRPQPPEKGLEVLSAWWERVRVLYSCWVTAQRCAKSPLWLASWHITFCLNSRRAFPQSLEGSLLCWSWTLNHFKFIKHLGICRF